MAWVRYDDQLTLNPKITAVLVEEPGALALHLVANTWTNTTKHPGFVPVHQPGALLYDRGLANKWTAVLVGAGLWHEVGQECERCRVYYADLPANSSGYVFHDAQDYRAPERERQTPGTPAEISKKRQEAGRRGGLATAARGKQKPANGLANAANDLANQANVGAVSVPNVDLPLAPQSAPESPTEASAGSGESGHIKQPVRANAASAASKASKRSASAVSPVPDPDPKELQKQLQTLPPSAGGSTPRSSPILAEVIDDSPPVLIDVPGTDLAEIPHAGTLTGDWVKYCELNDVKLTKSLIARYGKGIKLALEQGFSPPLIKHALAQMLADGEASRPSYLDNFLVRVQQGPARRPRRLTPGEESVANLAGGNAQVIHLAAHFFDQEVS